MATVGNVVGRMIVGMALDTAGLGVGIGQAEAQLTAFRATVTGAAQTAAAAGAERAVVQARLAVTAATERLNISELRLSELQSKDVQTASAVALARSKVRLATVALTDAQARLVVAEEAAVNPKVTKNPFSILSLGATLASLAVLKFGEDATHASAQFEYDMRLIQTQAGATEAEVHNMSEAVLRLAPSVQAGPDQLARALFHVESVGITGADALNVLATAAKGAAVGNADLESVTNALIAVVKSGIGGINDMSQAMGILNGIVGTGNLRMQDLATSFSSGVLSTAKQFGLGLRDVGAAIATMADQGIPAEEAATRLRITIALIGAPTKTAERELAKIGITGRGLADEMRGPNGLIGALTLLKTRMDQAGLDATEQSQLLKTAFGGSRSSAGILTLINSLELMGQKQDVIKQKSGTFLEDFKKESETAEGRFRTLSAIMGVLQVRIGNGILPFATALALAIGELAKHTDVLAVAFSAVTLVVGIAAARAFALLTISVLKTVKALVLAGAEAVGTIVKWVLMDATAAGTATSVEALAVAEGQASTANVALMTTTAAAGTTIEGLGFVAGASAVPIEGLAATDGLLATAEGAVAIEAVPAAAGVASVGVAAIVATGGVLLLVAAFIALGVAIVSIATKSEEARRMEDYQGRLAAAKARGLDPGKVPYLSAREKSSRVGGVHTPSAAESEAQKKADEEKLKDAGMSDVENYLAAAKATAISDFPGAIVDTLIEQWGTGMAGVEAAAATAGADDMSKYAKAIADAQQAPIDAFTALKEAIANELTPTQEIARNVGFLSSRELAEGLASSDPKVVAAAETLRKSAVERLDKITDGAYSAGQRAAGSLSEGIAQARGQVPTAVFDQMVRSYNALGDSWRRMAPSARAAAMALAEVRDEAARGAITAQQAAQKIVAAFRNAGSATKALAAAIKDGTTDVDSAAKAIVQRFGNDLRALSRVGRVAGADVMLAVAQGLKSREEAPLNALTDLHNMLKTQMSKNRQIAFLLAALAGQDIARGLHSSDPAVRAQALATRKTITDQLDVLTDGAYSAGQNAGLNYTSGWAAALKKGIGTLSKAALADLGMPSPDMFIHAPAHNTWKPPAGVNVSQGEKDYLAWLKALDPAAKAASKSLGHMASMAAAARSALTSAFDAIKAAAHKYFDELHAAHLRAIKDAHDHKNALLDAKEALIQGPVDAAQQALDRRRNLEEEARLRKAVAEAQDPQSRLDALQALNDFLEQNRIDQMQSEVDAEKTQLDAEKKHNDDVYDQQVAAENKRYKEQKQAFDRQLAALERYLKTHHETWRKAQEQIVALLKKYGINYHNAGMELGKKFVEGLKAMIHAAAIAAAQLSAAGTPHGTPTTSHAVGAWDLPRDEIARLHAREMVLNPSVATAVRGELGPHGMAEMPEIIRSGLAARAMARKVMPGQLSSTVVSSALQRALERRGTPVSAAPTPLLAPPVFDRTDRSSGGKIVLMIGNEVIDEVVDRRLRIRDDVYGETTVVGSSLR